jgi:hypothetical protein
MLILFFFLIKDYLISFFLHFLDIEDKNIIELLIEEVKLVYNFCNNMDLTIFI